MHSYSRQRIYFPGALHHIYGRAVSGENLFKGNSDYVSFLKKLRRYSGKYCISIIAWGLMPNHYHLLTRQETEISPGRMMQYLLNSYAMSYNILHQRKGHLFEERFRAEGIGDEALLLPISRYIHLNPVAAGLVRLPEQWEWSSYLDYVEKRRGTLCNVILAKGILTAQEYAAFCYEDIERSKVMQQHKRTQKKLRMSEVAN
jgi:REP element-mobilizing transposase RayT